MIRRNEGSVIRTLSAEGKTLGEVRRKGRSLESRRLSHLGGAIPCMNWAAFRLTTEAVRANDALPRPLHGTAELRKRFDSLSVSYRCRGGPRVFLSAGFVGKAPWQGGCSRGSWPVGDRDGKTLTSNLFKTPIVASDYPLDITCRNTIRHLVSCASPALSQ